MRKKFTVLFLMSLLALSAASMCAQSPAAAAPQWSFSGPPALYNSRAVLDTTTNKMVLFGGSLLGSNENSNSDATNAVWRLSGVGGSNETWTLLKPTGTAPSPRFAHAVAYDPSSNEMMVFGGDYTSDACFNDSWVLTNANGNGGTSAWMQLQPQGTAPGTRAGHSAVYDPNTNTLIIFGGTDCEANLYNDVWVLSDANGLAGTPAWTQLLPSGNVPAARQQHSAVYDPTHNRMIVFGGSEANGAVSNDVWVLSNANGSGGAPSWSQVSPAGALPTARAAHTGVYDPASNRMTIFGGQDASSSILSDVWVLSGANGRSRTPSWQQLGPFTPFFVEPKAYHTAVYNSTTKRMTVFGGLSNGLWGSADIWTLSNAIGE
jgi:hypothetical protein